MGALATAAGLRSLLGWFAFRRHTAGQTAAVPERPLLREIHSLAPAAAIFFLTAVVFTLHDRLDIVLVSMISGAEEAGYYGIASRFTAWLSILPGAMVAALYPYLSRRPDRDPATFRRLRLGAVLYGGAAALAALIIGQPLIRLVLGEAYLPAWGPMALRAWVLPLMMFAHFLAIRLYSQGREKAVAWRTAVGLLVNLTANLVLVPLYGGLGAAGAAVASGLTVTILLHHLSRKTHLGQTA
jgi:O-antigen/teichoic acid export membrane protein